MQNNSNTQSTISPNSNTPSSSLDTSLTTHESEPMKPRDQMIHDLYYKQNLPQKEIAKRLGISKSTVGRVFKKHGWTGRKGRRYSRRKDCPHPKEEDNIVRTQNKEKSDLLCSDGSVKRSKWNELDFEEVFRLYFDEKLSMQTIA
jgi:transposase